MDPLVHTLLFVLAAFAIVFSSATFHESEDQALLRGLPKRMGWFCFWCGGIALVMIVAQHTVASVR
jgi:hypothetical protein